MLQHSNDQIISPMGFIYIMELLYVSERRKLWVDAATTLAFPAWLRCQHHVNSLCIKLIFSGFAPEPKSS